MATRRVQLGTVGHTVRTEIAAARKKRRLTLRDLSERMTEIGWPISYNTLSEIERGARRVDVDDLSKLAEALETPVLILLGVPMEAEPISDEAAQIMELVMNLDRKARTDGKS